jgi:beta-ureidopropionase / N-carbamoyl-L-amino-acid hydrolase
MLALAAVITTARDAARLRDVVATVGKVLVQPNAVNAIPGEVTAWLDARGLPEASLRGLVAEVGAAGGVAPVCESWSPATVFDEVLRERVAAAAGGDLGPAPLLATAAGHDAGVLAAAGVPSAMLFVRNPTGVSHSPAEHAEPADCRAGIAALIRVVRELA